MRTELPDISYFRSLEQHLPAGHINISSNPHQGHQHTIIVRTSNLLFNSHAPLNGRRFGGCEHAGSLNGLIPWNPGDLFHPLQRIFTNPLNKGLPAVDIIFNKVFVEEPFFDNNIEHPQGQCGISPGSQL